MRVCQVLALLAVGEEDVDVTFGSLEDFGLNGLSNDGSRDNFHDGALIPKLVVPANQRWTFSSIQLPIWDKKRHPTHEIRWELEEIEKIDDHDNLVSIMEIHQRICSLKARWNSLMYGHQSLHVTDNNGAELFKIRANHMTWNPVNVVARQTYHIMTPNSKDKHSALHTIIKDYLPSIRGEEEIRIYRGNGISQPGAELTPEMICVGYRSTWEYKFYNSEEERSQGRDPIGSIVPHDNPAARNGGFVVKGQKSWLPELWDLKAETGVDAGLMLAVTAVLDLSNAGAGNEWRGDIDFKNYVTV